MTYSEIELVYKSLLEMESKLTHYTELLKNTDLHLEIGSALYKITQLRCTFEEETLAHYPEITAYEKANVLRKINR